MSGTVTAVDVSVIVCTRNRADSLARCLASIDADPSTVPAEIVVVDNASRDSTANVIKAAAQHASRPLISRWSSEPGHSRARNLGIRHARGSILVFTDDDTQVQPGWLDALTAPFADRTVAATGGRVIPTFACERPEWLTENPVFSSVTLQDFGQTAFDFDGSRLPLGANMALRASVLEQDPFDPRLGHSGTIAFGFDELYLLARLGRNHRLAYAPEAEVWHILDESRLTPVATRRILFHIGFGLSRYQRLLGAPPPALTRRLVRAIRAWTRVGRHADTEADRAHAWHWAGRHTEDLLGPRAMPLSNWCAAHLAPRATSVSGI